MIRLRRNNRMLYIYRATLIGLLFHINISIGVGAELTVYPCTVDNANKIVKIKSGKLLICYFGSKPEIKKNGWVSVTGVSFHRLMKGLNKRVEFIVQEDEYGIGIDYKVKETILNILWYIETYPGFRSTPFFSEKINIDSNNIIKNYHIVYKYNQYSEKEIADSVKFLRLGEKEYRKLYFNNYGPGKIYSELFKLRDYAFKDPEFIELELKKMENYWWCDGEMAEVLEGIQNNVMMIKMIKK